jgi:hypothetical protein
VESIIGSWSETSLRKNLKNLSEKTTNKQKTNSWSDVIARVRVGVGRH